MNNVNTNSDGNEIEPETEVTALTQEQVDSRKKRSFDYHQAAARSSDQADS